MKYRIKIEHLNNGKKYYTPQVKTHLFGSWKNIFENSTSKTMRYVYKSEKEACDAIIKYKEFLNEEFDKQVKSVSYINIWW